MIDEHLQQVVQEESCHRRRNSSQLSSTIASKTADRTQMAYVIFEYFMLNDAEGTVLDIREVLDIEFLKREEAKSCVAILVRNHPGTLSFPRVSGLSCLCDCSLVCVCTHIPLVQERVGFPACFLVQTISGCNARARGQGHGRGAHVADRRRRWVCLPCDAPSTLSLSADQSTPRLTTCTLFTNSDSEHTNGNEAFGKPPSTSRRLSTRSFSEAFGGR